MIVRKISEETKVSRKRRPKVVQSYRGSSRTDGFIEEVRISTSSLICSSC